MQGIADDVAQLLAAGALGNGQVSSLTQKLQAAIDQIGDGQPTSAINLLNALINRINALMSGNNPVLTQAQGQPLIDAANAIIDSLSP